MEKQYEEAAREFLGIPYRHGGRDRTGLDCLGLASLFYKKLGIDLPAGDGRPYTTDWYKSDPERFRRGLEQIGRAVDLKTEPLAPLDLVYFRVGGAITHAGVMINRHSFLHVMNGQEVRISPLTFAWKRRLQGARRLI